MVGHGLAISEHWPCGSVDATAATVNIQRGRCCVAPAPLSERRDSAVLRVSLRGLLMSHESDEVWLAKVNADYDQQDGDLPASEVASSMSGDEESFSAAPVDLDENAGSDDRPEPTEVPVPDGTGSVFGDGTDDAQNKPAAKRFDHKVAASFGGIAAAAVVVALAAGVMFYSGDDDTPHAPRDTIAEPAAVAVAKPAPTPAPAPDADRPLPYSADAAGSCAAGSTSAQSMSGSDPRNAFVCVRGGADGQVITLDLSKVYVITAIKITPGWVGKDASDVSQWSQHRVVSTVQYSFNDVDHTFITQETGNVHGEAVVKVKRVLASKITMLIRQTSRPPAQPEPTAPPANGQGGDGGILPGIFGPGAPTVPPLPSSDPFAIGTHNSPNSDPVDAKFAISRLEVIGHDPI